MAMSDHGQDARATSELTLEGAVEEGLEEIIQAAAALGLAGFERPNFGHAGGELALEGNSRVNYP